jgi:hypothetical protein
MHVEFVYAGIGSRKTPFRMLNLMAVYASKLAELGFTLRSGGAIGADQAFERGAGCGPKEIFRAADATPAAIDVTAEFHSAWDACTPHTKQLHGRNAMIVLGRHLDEPAKFCICWTKDGKDSGGTGQAIRIANGFNIRIFNLFFPEVIAELDRLIVSGSITTKWPSQKPNSIF